MGICDHNERSEEQHLRPFFSFIFFFSFPNRFLNMNVTNVTNHKMEFQYSRNQKVKYPNVHMLPDMIYSSPACARLAVVRTQEWLHGAQLVEVYCSGYNNRHSSKSISISDLGKANLTFQRLLPKNLSFFDVNSAMS
jgi:hypothetical protein